MNRNRYRLVFNRQRNAWLAVAETVRGRGKRSARRSPAPAAAVVLGLAMALAGSALAGPTIPAANALPVPSSGSRPFVFAGSVNGGQPSVTGNTMTITTPSRALGLNWASFNIGSDASLTFNQPDATSRVLNRIWSADPSVIMGRLNANGEVYLINQNGILFGNGAQVNVGGLLASALNLSDSMASQLLNSGLPSVRGDRLEFAWDGSAAGYNAGFVTLDAGAKVSTPSGGRVLLIAPKTAENLGLIEGGGGAEAILAAGGKVILTAPDDPNLRGLLVETKSFTGKDSLGNNVSLDGSVSNKADGTANNGRIDTGSGGVVTLAALAVNQKGMVNASKAVNLNGTTMLVSGTTESNRLTINQRGDRAEIDWVSGFNVGAGKTVEFVQQSTGAVAYNYVHDADRTAADGSVLNVAGRSNIDGMLKASGQLFLINEKGVSFGATANVKAASFVASGLGVNSSVVTNGIFAQDVNSPSFSLSKNQLQAGDQSDFDSKSASAKVAFRAATIDVATGAKIGTTIDNGFVMLVGSAVTQGGTITTPKGQTLLAAGAEVYLKPPFSAGLRGFIAEVNPLYLVKTWNSNQWGVIDHGAVTNTGTISASLGNISFSANDITQAGRLTTSTSATSNGSIRLVARDLVGSAGQRKVGTDGVAPYVQGESYSASKAIDPDFVVGQNGGTLRFASGSFTEVVVDGSGGKTISADQNFVSSSIEAMAKKITIDGNAGSQSGASLVARGGRIQLMASERFDLTRGFAGDPFVLAQTSTPATGVGIFVGDGAKLDVSGVTAQKKVNDLFIEVELRGDEFANNTVQRLSRLRGKTAWVDSRDAVKIADLSGWISKIGQTVEEKTATGGTISLKTSGSIIVKPNAELNVSGGGVDYAGGTVTESRVLSIGGNGYRLNDAPVSAIYYGIRDRKSKLAGYSEGRSAGTLEFLGNSLALDGKLIATTTRGSKQRNISTSTTDHYAVPLGGKLIIEDAGQHFPVSDRDAASEEEKIREYTNAQIAFIKGAANVSAGLEAGDSAGRRLELSQSLIDAGFSRFDIKSDGRIDVGADINLNLAPGGEFKLAGRQVYVAGDISAPNGKISLSTRDMSTAAGLFPTLSDAKYSTLIVDNGGNISTAGQWINDSLDRKESSRKTKATSGGSISLVSVYDIDLRAGSHLNVSGGALVNAKSKLEAGNAGSIVMTTGGMLKSGGFNFTADMDKRDASLFLDGTLAAYALGSGGSLEINTSAVVIGEQFAADSRNWTRSKRLAENQVGVALTSDFFNNYGFYDYKLVGRDGVTVKDGTRIEAKPINWSLLGLPGYRRKASGSDLASFARSVVLHPDLRSSSTDLTLATRSLEYGDLLVGDNTYLGVSPKGSINLESWAQLTVLGTLQAPAGNIKLSRPANRISEIYNIDQITYSEAKQSESVYLGPNSRLLAAGTTVLSATTRQGLEAGVSADSLRERRRYKGEVLPGGKVDIDAGMGYLITTQGSLIDVAGAQDRINAPSATSNGGLSYDQKTLGSAGGLVSLAARDGMLLDGTFDAKGKNSAPGGALSLRFADAEAKTDPWAVTPEPTVLANRAPPGFTAEESALLGGRTLTLYQSVAPRAGQWPANIDAAAYLAGSARLDPLQFNGKAALDLVPLQAAGFGSWYLASQDVMRFSGSITATLNNQLRLDAPKFQANSDVTRLNLTAAAIQLGSYAPTGAPVTSAATGGGAAVFSARDIGISGNFTWNGFATSQFNSTGEIHFDSTANSAPNHTGGRNFSGQMTASGALGFAAARLSPSTYSDYRVDLSSDANGSITITRPAGAVADESIAAGGRLEFAAQDILHAGTVTAPLGEIVFSSSAPGGKVTLGETSVTSVTANRTMMLGQTDQSGRYWQFNSYYWNAGSKSLSSVNYKVERAPEKAIRIDTKNSIVQAGAKFDLSAGGEAIAAEFTPGPGGKADILAISPPSTEAAVIAANTTAMSVFAVLPGWNGQFAPQDSQAMGYSNVSSPSAIKASDGSVTYRYDSIPTLKPGNQVQFAANSSGLAAGTYTLLPASYALLPGAYLISVKPTSDRVVARSRGMTDGGWLVNGSILAANADGSRSAYSQSALTFEVANPSLVSARAKYQVSRLSEFFFDTVGNRLPGDAGLLSVIGRNSLTFNPSIVAMRQAEITASDGRNRAGDGLQLDIAADKLFISDGATAPDASWSVIDQSKLVALGATSILLGGVRSSAGASTEIDTIASKVLVQNSGVTNAVNALYGPELMLSAKDVVKVTTGSRIEALGKATGRQVVLDGDGAFMRVAEGEQAGISRAGSVNLSTGSLQVDAGAMISGQSMIFDATKNDGSKNTFLDGTLLLGMLQANASRNGGALTIGAGRINVVGDGSTPADGLTLDNGDLTRFALADQLRLTSYTTLDLYGNAVLGATDLKELVIGAAGIAGHGSGTANIVAKSVVFDNPNTDSAIFTAGAVLGGGTLQVSAERISFGANVKDQAKRDAGTTGFAIRGFDNVGLQASGDVRFTGLGVTAIDNDVTKGGSGTATALTVDAGRMVTVGTADHLMVASGKTGIRGGTSGGSAVGLGGALEVRAQAIEVSGRIETPSGKLTLAATGPGVMDHVTIKDKAVIAAEGSKVAFADTFAYAPGGQVRLTSTKGNVAIETGAIVSVAADAGGGDAGALLLDAQAGSVSAAAGALRAKASTNDASLNQGSLTVVAGTVSLDGLADAVTETLVDGTTREHFGGQWDIRSRTGNLSLAKSIVAKNVTIAADNGGITVDSTGKIGASGAKGGTIELYSRNGDVKLDGTLLAMATEKIDSISNAGTRGQGGTVVLAADGTGKVITAVGSSIDVGVANGSVASGGKVNFRAGKSTSIVNRTDLNIQLAGGISGASDVSAEIVSNYTGTSLKTGTTSGPAATRALGLSSIQSDLNALYSAANVITLLGNLGFADTATTRFHVRPGVDITTPINSTSDFTVSSDLNLSSFRFADVSGNATEAGVLTIRVPKSLRINNTISDGFISPGLSAPNGTERDAMIASGGDSWSYRLVAGADSSAANVLATNSQATTSHLQIASGKLVRTGTGNIDLVAAGNITLASRAAVYTAGVDDGSVPANFVQLGSGDDDSLGTKAHFSQYGGDLWINAGGSVTQSATSLISDWLVRYSGGSGSTQWWSRTASFLQGFGTFGGGDIAISAGGNITGVTAATPTNGRVPAVDGEARADLAVILGGGDLKVSAGSNISGGQFYAESGDLYLTVGKSVLSNPTISLGNTSGRVVSRQDASLGNITNSLSSKRDSLSYKDSSGNPMGNGDLVNDEYKVRIGTYSDHSNFDLVTINGNVKLNGSTDAGFNLAPSRVKVAALNGDISGTVNQSPGSQGQLDLLAGKSILVPQGILQFDTPASELPSILNPLEFGSVSPYTLTVPSLAHSKIPWHVDDPEPSRLIALGGNISGPGSKDVTARFSEPVLVEATGDVKDGLSIVSQHLKASDISRIQADGSIAFRDTSNASTVFQIDGPGRLEVIAGKNVDLGAGRGIVSRGNLENPYLPLGGADILVMAGTTSPDYSGFMKHLQDNGLSVGSDTSPNGLRDRFYTLLREFGNEAVSGGGEPAYEKGRTAIRALFPASTVNKGNIDLFYSAIKTEQGGRIDLLAPGGGVTVGIANPSSTIPKKKAADQGLFSFRGGDIRAFVRDSFLVNQSRVFTLDGGNILVWADRGSIDAGTGAKTVSATPPPVLVVRDGQIFLDASNSVSGSGIGALASRDTSPISNIDLFAPQGAIDAGDAGLRSTGNVTLGAQTILNASNIQAAGTVSGAPAPAASAAPAPAPTSPTNTEKGDAQAASALASNRETPLGVLTVEVLDSGEAAAEPAAEKDEEKKKKR